MSSKISDLVLLLEKQNEALADRERELNEKAEELEAQKEELTAAIEELVKKNNFLNATLAELEDRNHELDQLVYRASHDFKTPVTSTLGILHLMEREPLSPFAKEYTQRIRLAMQQMNDLLKSLALFTKAALEEITTSKTNLRTCVQEAIDGLAYLENIKNARFEILIDELLETETDKILLIEALKAIINNSIVFNDKAEIKIKISAEIKNGNVLLNIEDNGEGMSGEVLKKASTIFYRGSEKSKGTGLGLYMVKKIIQRLDGKVTLTSLREGLKVTLSIPHR